MVRPFRFGVQLSEATSRSDWVNRARRAEELGYSTVCLPDHIGTQLAPFPALVAIADATRSLRVGTFVIDNDFLLQDCEVTGDRDGVAADHASELGIEAAELLALPFELIGTLNEMAEDLTRRRERYGLSYITVFERHMETFAPLIERLAGT